MAKLNTNVDRNKDKYRDYIIKKAALFKAALFFCALLFGAILSGILPLRPSISENEKRVLNKFPHFEVIAFLNGTYFNDIDTWFSDTFPFRDTWIACNDQFDYMYGFRNTMLHGEVLAGDEIPDVVVDVDALEGKDSLAEDKESINNNENVLSSAVSESQLTQISIDDIGTDVEDTDGSTMALAGERLGSIFVVGNAAYNYYAFSKTDSDLYVGVMNELANVLDGRATLYNMVVPTSIDISLDDATRNSLSSSNQKKAILYMYSQLSSKVKVTYLYDIMREHRNEYIYFRTDHHWTALGAYYAYSAFMTQIGKHPNSLDSYERMVFPGFKGSFYTQSGVVSLGNNPDTVFAYIPLCTNRLRLTDRTGSVSDYNIITNVSDWNATSKYSTFIGGDNPLSVIHNPNMNDGSSCLVIKESYGNAFAPFLSDHYENVYIMDYRYYQGTVSDLVDQYGISTVIAINNISATSTQQRVLELQKVCQ